MLYPLTLNHVGRPFPDDRTLSEIRLRYNDQPQSHETCTCGSCKAYSRCCGKSKKIKHKEIIITFKSTPGTERYHLDLTPDGVFVYVNGEKALIVSSEIRTIYERDKSPKILNKIFNHGLIPLITPDNIFQHVDIVFAIDTNTSKETAISVCAVTSVLPDKTSTASTFSIDSRTGRMSVGRCSGDTILETVFAFVAQEYSAENLAWHIVIDSIRNSTDYIEGKKYALIVDSDLDNLLLYNCKQSPYFMSYVLPENMTLIYASADRSNKNNSLLNYSIHFCEKNANLIIEKEADKLKAHFANVNNPKTTSINCLFRKNGSPIFSKYSSS